MKKILIAFTVILFASDIVAQTVAKTIAVTGAGTLSSLLTTIEKNTVTDLTVTGSIDARDIKCLRDEMAQLSVLDIKNASLVAYSGSDGTLSSAVNYPVNEIPQYSFYDGVTGKATLTKIYLSDKIASIGDYAFYNCAGLVIISVAATVPPVCQPNTFKGVDQTKCVLEVPYGLNEIYPAELYWVNFIHIIEKGIKDVTGLTAGSLSSVLDADEKATTVKLTITGDIDARDIKCMRDNMPMLSLLDMAAATVKEFVGVGGTFGNVTHTYPANEMPAFSFYDGTVGKTSLTNLKMPSTITSIGQSAFYQCSNLAVSLAIPNAVTSIGIYVFKGCGNLINEPLKLPENLTVIEEGAFELCSNIKGSLQIPSKVTRIKDSGFRNCTSLAGLLTIPSGVSDIGFYTFENCKGFTKISVERSTPPVIQSNTFNGLDKAACVLEVPIGSSAAYQAADYWKEFTITEKGLKVINLTTPGTLSSILTNDEKLTITNLTITGDLDARDIKCLRDELAQITVLDISNANIVAYSGTAGTMTANTTYPANEMPQSSFYLGSMNGRSTLTTIVLPKTLTSIGASAFGYCENISTISIPNSVTSIGMYAFSNCRSLAGVLTIPNSVATIGDYAFCNCTNITKIAVGSTVPAIIQTNTFQFVNKTTCVLDVPVGSTATYLAADYWKEFKSLSIVNGIDDVYANKYAIRVVNKNISVDNVENVRVSCFDCLGRCVFSAIDSNPKKDFTVPRSGVYVLRIENDRLKLMIK